LRTPREIAFRLKQELTNARLYLRPPQLGRKEATPSPLPSLPDPKTVVAGLRDSAFEAEVAALAQSILQHRFPLLGTTVETGPRINWRRDNGNAKETDLRYFRRIAYLDPVVSGDHKAIWELNRHQHLVLLAQAYCFSDDQSLVDELILQLESWFAQNPFQAGINWASALEVAFRALSWIWIYHLVGHRFQPAFRTRFLEHLNRHGLHIENNLSYYFSPNTHLLGEAVSLHALGTLFPQLPRARRWERLGAKIVEQEMQRQVRADGGHFEQSTYYHVYALDMFLFHAILKAPAPQYRDKLVRMAEFLHALLGPARRLPFFGDDDGGRFFHPFGQHDQFGRATIATCSQFLHRSDWQYEPADLAEQSAWWLGNREGAAPVAGQWTSQLFPDTGIAVLSHEDIHIVVDAGPFGPWGSGHSHSDTLSLTVRVGVRDILIDPGTYTYTETSTREAFRGSAAHNTIKIDGGDQAIPVNPFRWRDQPAVRILNWETNPAQDRIEAECQYRGFTHRRTVTFEKPAALLRIEDDIAGPPGDHDIEQFWHLGAAEDRDRFTFDGEIEQNDGWRSRAMGQKEPATVLRLHRRSKLPLRLETRMQLR
jgi:heparinase II/III-like protein